MQLLLMIAVFFIAAGRLNIERGWIYFGIAAVTYMVSSLILVKYNPELLNERAKTKDDTKTPDISFLILLYIFGFIGTHVVAGLDIGRFQLSQLSILFFYPGIILYFIDTALNLWAMVVNKHFEVTIRIQVDKGHKVIKKGPYKIIRHPGYLSILITWLSLPLMLGSLYSFFCIGAVFIIVFLRTAYEDQVLQKLLPGYDQYATEVKYKLIPGVF